MTKLSIDNYILSARSDRLIAEILAHFNDNNKLPNDKINNRLIESLIKDRSPNLYRHQDTMRAGKYIDQESEKPQQDFVKKDFKFLDSVIDEYFYTNNNLLVRKEKYLIKSQPIIDNIAMTFIAGYFYAQEIGQNGLTINALRQIAKIYPEWGTTPEQLMPSLGKLGLIPMVDNHLHWGGADNPSALVLGIILSPVHDYITDQKKSDTYIPIPPEFTFIRSGKLSIAQIIALCQLALYYLEHKFYYQESNDCAKIINRVSLPPELNSEYMPHFAKIHFVARQNADIFQQLYQNASNLAHQKNATAAALLLQTACHWLYQSPKTKDNDKYFIKILLHGMGIIRSLQIMAHQNGLEEFGRYYNHAAKHRKNNFQTPDEYNRIIFDNGTQKASFRFGFVPDFQNGFFPEQNKYFLKYFYDNNHNKPDDFYKFIKQALPNYHKKWQNSDLEYYFIYHFKRTNYKEKGLHFRNRKIRQEIMKTARELDILLTSLKYKSYPISMLSSAWFPEFNLKNYIQSQDEVDLTQLIKGIDIAGMETHQPPEVFAPAFHFLRDKLTIKSFEAPEYLREESVKEPRLFATVHCGEDFPHILSGLRMIDETVEFLNLGAGDSLGHALALGFDPARFMQDGAESYLEQHELCDNLLFILYCLDKMAGKYNPPEGYINRIYDNWKRLTKDIYGKPCYDAMKGKKNWYDAWILRKYDTLLVNNGIDGTNKLMAPKELQKILYENDKKDDIILTINMRMHNEKWQEKARKLICVKHIGNGAMKISNKDEFFTNQDDLNVIHAIQDFKISEYYLKSIAIETCPSSNQKVAKLETLKDHPIFRFFPVNSKELAGGEKYNKFGLRCGKINCTINTDDPGIFATSLPNEYRLLKESALLDYPNDLVDNWLEEIAAFSLLKWRY